jgi:hypothetical protein
LIQKNGGRVNGKQTFRPYPNQDNIDFFILEIISFSGNFYIIPIKVMIEQGLIKTNSQNGKREFNLPIPIINNKNCWIQKYLNNFEP